MKFLLPKEAGELLGLKTDTVYQYIRRGKIKATKASNGRHKISEAEIKKIHKEKTHKEKFCEEYFCIQQLEDLGINKKYILEGFLEAKKVDGKYYCHFLEVKRFLVEKRKIDKFYFLSMQRVITEFTILNLSGIHMRPAATIISLCNQNSHGGLTVKITYKGKIWSWPSMQALELLAMEIPFQGKIKLDVEGYYVARFLDMFQKAISIKFNVSKKTNYSSP